MLMSLLCVFAVFAAARIVPSADANSGLDSQQWWDALAAIGSTQSQKLDKSSAVSGSMVTQEPARELKTAAPESKATKVKRTWRFIC